MRPFRRLTPFRGHAFKSDSGTGPNRKNEAVAGIELVPSEALEVELFLARADAIVCRDVSNEA
jgi:hypothetical protein